MNRAERRRHERELEKTRPAPGRGRGYRPTSRGRVYRVREHRQPVDIARLERASDEARARIRTGCVEP